VLGDRVRVLVDAGGGSREYVVIEALTKGRRLVVRETSRQVVVVEVGKTGRDVRAVRFQARRVLSVEELPVRRTRPRRGPATAPGQTHLDDYLGGEGETVVNPSPPGGHPST
jgi:hypothetical protein